MNFRSRQEIEIDFVRAINEAEELEALANNLTQMAIEHDEGAIAMLSKGFKGENGRLFMKKSDGLKSEMLDAADDLIKVAKSIRQTADIVYRAEKSSIGIFV